MVSIAAFGKVALRPPNAEEAKYDCGRSGAARLAILRVFCGFVLLSVAAPRAADAAGQLPIVTVERMPRLPQPLDVHNWRAIARAYYERVLDPNATGDGFPAVRINPGDPGFQMKSYLGGDYAAEGFACLASVIGARLVGLDLRNLHGNDYVTRCQAWYDAQAGLYRHVPGDRSSVVSADIYGYWDAIQGMMLAAQYPDDMGLQHQARTAAAAFEKIARGLGCPDHPDGDVLGWDFAAARPGGRAEPMNRLGNAPSVAWMLTIGATLDDEADRIACARSLLNWYGEHPGRYEISHVMGPLAAARLNAEPGLQVDMGRVMSAWFGEGDERRFPWRVTAGSRLNGITCDGLDGARWGDDGFYAFTMGSLQGPAWLAPVVRYDARFARAVARYALHAANSARLLQGNGLDANHQDHAAWKARWDPQNLFFYEGLASWDPTETRLLRPYATGDPVLNGWDKGHSRIPPNQYLAQRAAWFGATPGNIALYMGNHVGFLGGIVSATEVPGILAWDCVATDWFHAPAYPTHLYYNPYAGDKTIALPLAKPVDLYDLASGGFIAHSAGSGYELKLPADAAVVLVETPVHARLERRGERLLADGIVVDFHLTALAKP